MWRMNSWFMKTKWWLLTKTWKPYTQRFGSPISAWLIKWFSPMMIWLLELIWKTFKNNLTLSSLPNIISIKSLKVVAACPVYQATIHYQLAIRSVVIKIVKIRSTKILLKARQLNVKRKKIKNELNETNRLSFSNTWDNETNLIEKWITIWFIRSNS